MSSKFTTQVTGDLNADTSQNVSRGSDIAPGRIHKPAAVSRNVQLLVVLTGAIAIASIASHVLTDWVKINTTASELFVIGEPNGKPPAFLAGSSLADYGISWEEVSTQLDIEIRTWGIAGSSPFEWELFQRKVPEARTTFIVVSALELDEAYFCDFRAAIVPVGHTIATLRASHADWDYCRRALSQYPMTWLRTLFPTLGRSRGLMGILHMKAKEMIKASAGTSETEAGPMITFGTATFDDKYKQQRMSDWPESKIIGKVAAMRVAFKGRQSFNGPKRLAFERMLRYADQRGPTFVIVLPVSPAYVGEFLHPEIAQKFQDALAELQRSAPRAEWLRLDQLPGLSSADNFCDLGHMNVFGKQIATEAFQAWLRQPGRQP